MWVVVYFNIDKSVDFVPNTWYNKGCCAWPKKKGNIKHYVESCVDPIDRPDDFQYFDARVLSKHPIDDIHEARTKASKAQNTSDLSSHTEDENYKGKPRVTTSLFASNKNQTCTSYKDEIDGPSFPDFNEFLVNEPNSEITGLLENHSKDLSTTSINESLNMHGFSNKKIKLNTINESPLTSLMYSSAKICNDSSDSKGYQKSMNRNIITLKHEVKNIQDRLDLVINMQEKIFDKLCNQSMARQGDFFDESNDFEITIIENEDCLNVMEQKLTETSFKKNMIKQLSRLMGQNMAETVRKVMQKLFSDSFLCKYSYIGFKGKKNFSTLKICKIIFESIRRMKKFSNATDVEIEKPLKNWMAQATPRLQKIVADKNKNDDASHIIL